MSNHVFVDTWAWLALALRRDQHHSAAKRRHAELLKDRRQYVTSDYVLSELATQLYRSTAAHEAEAFFAAVLAAVKSEPTGLSGSPPTVLRTRGNYAASMPTCRIFRSSI